jgi:hypothetical protein
MPISRQRRLPQGAFSFLIAVVNAYQHKGICPSSRSTILCVSDSDLFRRCFDLIELLDRYARGAQNSRKSHDKIAAANVASSHLSNQ